MITDFGRGTKCLNEAGSVFPSKKIHGGVIGLDKCVVWNDESEKFV